VFLSLGIELALKFFDNTGLLEYSLSISHTKGVSDRQLPPSYLLSSNRWGFSRGHFIP
jgi:hypothetical protein